MKVLDDSPKSRFDPSRDTVGKIYQEAQKDRTPIIIGDMSNSLTTSLVEDLNDAMLSDPFSGRPFYLMVYEKRDLQMKNMFLRRLYKTLYRPYPEDDTVVFHVNPKNQETRFCWCLPHWAEMDNIIMNKHLWNADMVRSIIEWRANNLKSFGFRKDSNGNAAVIKDHVDQLIS